nr:MAG TPA: hypothetical protein [Caudoviricetes sp.]
MFQPSFFQLQCKSIKQTYTFRFFSQPLLFFL